jgi:hypothetical protein
LPINSVGENHWTTCRIGSWISATSVTGEGDAMQMSKQELIEAANEMTGGNIKGLSLDQLYRLVTVALYVSDQCLNEIEDRRALLRRPRRRDHTGS